MATDVAADAPVEPDLPLVFLSELHDRFRADVDGDPAQPPGGGPATGRGDGDRSGAIAGPATPAPDAPVAAGEARERGAPATTPRRRFGRAAGVVALIGLVVALVAAVAVGSSGGDGGADAETRGPAETPTTSAPVPPPSPAEAFRLASERLQSGGSFAYTGTVHATDVSRARPGLWLAVDVLVTGEVDLLAGRVRETAVVPGSGATETVTDGIDAWGRSAPDPEGLPVEAYQGVSLPSEAESGHLGAALLPVWLGFAGGAEDAGPDELGRASFRAVLPAEALGEVQRGQGPVAAVIVLSLDEAGGPARVEITSVPDGAQLRVVYDISGIGDPVVITPPPPDSQG